MHKKSNIAKRERPTSPITQEIHGPHYDVGENARQRKKRVSPHKNDQVVGGLGGVGMRICTSRGKRQMGHQIRRGLAISSLKGEIRKKGKKKGSFLGDG